MFENSDDSNKQIKEPLVDLLPIFEQVILPENVNSEEKSDKSFIEESDIEPSVAKKGRSKKLSKKSPSKNFDCFICDKNFSSRLNKMNHIKDVHDQEVHVCTICNFISVSAKYLDQHMKNHKISKNFLCEHCSKKFFVLSHLRVGFFSFSS